MYNDMIMKAILELRELAENDNEVNEKLNELEYAMELHERNQKYLDIIYEEAQE